ncbi:MAG: ComEA family DNA-binding protein [Candidatus Omnitrophota bacterium]|jgi:competence protein ComEA
MFNLTQQERRVILFLTALVLIGSGANFIIKMNSKARTIPALSFDIARLNLNNADKDALMRVPGIGEKLAQRILDYRFREGGFGDIEELKGIKGISGYRYERLKDYVTVK